MNINWAEELPGAITVCDKDAKILYLNSKAAKTFEKDGGKNLIGKSLYDCHPPIANEKIKELLATQNKNSYTIEKNGVKKLIYQTPWFENEEFMGFVELSLEIPFEMAHFIRK